LFIHTSDTHIGSFTGKRLLLANVKALEEIIEYAENNGIKQVVIAGDVFEYPRIENYDVLKRVVNLLNTCRKNGLKIIVTPGSHDHSIRGNDLLSILREAELINVTEYVFEPGLLKLKPLIVDDRVFYGLPGFKNEIETEYLRDNKVRFQDIEKYKEIVLIAHTSIEFGGYKLSELGGRYTDLKAVSEDVLKRLPSSVKYIALGHIHFPIPLIDDGFLPLAYPGAPIGRDLNDLVETVKLNREHGRKRRFLVVDVDREKPYVKSVWSDFNTSITLYKTSYRNLPELLQEVKRVVKDIEGVEHEFKVLIITIENTPSDQATRVVSEIRGLEKNSDVDIYVKTFSKEVESGMVFDTTSGMDIESIEREHLKKFIEKTGLKISVETLHQVLEILGQPRPDDVKKDDYYRSLLSKVMELMGV